MYTFFGCIRKYINSSSKNIFLLSETFLFGILVWHVLFFRQPAEGREERAASRGSNYSQCPNFANALSGSRARFLRHTMYFVAHFLPFPLSLLGTRAYSQLPKSIFQSVQCTYLVNFHVFLNCNPLHDWRFPSRSCVKSFCYRRWPSAKHICSFVCWMVNILHVSMCYKLLA